MKRPFLIAAMAASLSTGQTLACACSFTKVAIAPVTVENGDTYHGSALGVEVLFHNDVTDHAVTQFPEAPMTVRRAQPAGECRVDDGGVFDRAGVWLSGDGLTLATIEGSGSAEDLVFRDVRSCVKVATLDVAGQQWRVQGKVLVLHKSAGQRGDRRVPLDATCRPAPPARAAH